MLQKLVAREYRGLHGTHLDSTESWDKWAYKWTYQGISRHKRASIGWIEIFHSVRKHFWSQNWAYNPTTGTALSHLPYKIICKSSHCSLESQKVLQTSVREHEKGLNISMDAQMLLYAKWCKVSSKRVYSKILPEVHNIHLLREIVSMFIMNIAIRLS